jgi:hypothetical protein
MMRRALGLCALALLMAAGGAEAASLDKETCDKLKAEQVQLEGTDARVNMAKGPDWAKANLGPEKLGEIKRLIEVEELLLFRCQGRPLVVLPPEIEADAAKPDDAKENGKEPPAKDAPKDAPKDAKAAGAEKGAGSAPVAKKAPPQAGKAAAGKDAAAKKADASAKAAKAGNPAPAKATKAKPKADDAYRPPSQDPAADPFAKQLAPADKK